MKNRPELLAPAGSPEAFAAAFKAGADAFYMGVGDFNARRRARNFSREELAVAVRFAHRNGRRVYITLNTLLFDDELAPVVELLSFLEELRVDGVIVQDLGLLSLIRGHFPAVPVHASTQMFCHNSQQAEFLKKAGVARIILARELSIEEMRGIASAVPLEYEVFVHGAMCFSFSGCCLFSSYLYGDSGNRGRCRQPCRLPFEGARGRGYPFSMRDLSAGEIIRELAASGITALKIEGRLRNADYVANAVGMYRALIDESPAPRHAGRIRSRSLSGSARESGIGYFHGRDYDRLVAARSAGGSGEPLGEVISASGRVVVFASAVEIAKGSKLRVVDPDGRMMYEGTLLHYSRSGKGAYEWTLPVKAPGARGMRVYLTGESRAFGDWPMIKREAGLHKYIPARLDIRLSQGALKARALVDEDVSFEFKSPLQTGVAKTRAVTANDVEKLFSQTDRFPLVVRECRVDVAPGLFVRSGLLKGIRRKFHESLYGHYESERNRRNEERTRAALAHIEAIGNSSRSDERFYFEYADMAPGGSADFRVVEFESLSPSDRPGERDVVLLPLFVSEERLPMVREVLASLVERGFYRFMIPTYGWAEYLRRFPEVELFGGPFLYIVNSLAYAAMKRAGVGRFTISPDMMGERVVTRAYRGYVEPRAYRKELMATRLRLSGECYRGAGTLLRVIHRGEYDVIYEEDK
ncbi:MAG: putative protease YhbU precursor [Spirochaetes bacterium ADurb.BinA120]|nr:MAG: putative protease YhbU precursor [Spirochaetes bacterium ADurb.BinA120]